VSYVYKGVSANDKGGEYKALEKRENQLTPKARIPEKAEATQPRR
jgi:hypothetical protein